MKIRNVHHHPTAHICSLRRHISEGQVVHPPVRRVPHRSVLSRYQRHSTSLYRKYTKGPSPLRPVTIPRVVRMHRITRLEHAIPLHLGPREAATARPAAVESADLRHLRVSEYDVHHIQVLGEAVRLDRFREGGHPACDLIRQRYLRGALAPLGADGTQRRVARDRDAVLRPRRLSRAWGAQRAVRSHHHAQLAARLEQRFLREVRVRLHLVAHGLDPRVAAQLRELLRVEVGHADRLHQPLVHQRLHRPPRLDDRHACVLHVAALVSRDARGAPLRLRHLLRPVHQVQVEVL
mmetsp:Transcript_10528/g.23454  ORF Transcript_10528/g.23454 Transcript_10528/m.23454 type:complete len:293 (-) Transcript_10528:399-1277(-)